MHELSVCEQIVAIAVKKAEGAKILRIVIEIGKLSCLLPDAVRFAFDIASEGTAAEGAKLEIRELPGRARCRTCGLEMTLERPYGECQCGGSDLEWLAGEELNLCEMEVL